MRIAILLISLLLSEHSIAQIVDGFEGDSLHTDWKGDREKFSVSGKLMSNSSITGDEFAIDRIFERTDTLEFRLSIRLDFPTSSVNYVELVFADDASEQIICTLGGTGDEVSFMFDEGIPHVLQGSNTERSEWQIRMTLTDSNVHWTVYDVGRNQQFDSATSVALNIAKLRHFELRIKQSTSSFFGKHEFDDLYIGPRIRDTIAPRIDTVLLPDHRHIELCFNEPVDTTRIPKCSMKEGSISSFGYTGESSLRLVTAEPLIDDLSYLFEIADVYDIEGNMFDTLIQLIPRIPVPPAPGYVLITELMPDPLPSVALPEVEFLELTNTTDHYLNLDGCSVLDIGNSVQISDLIIGPRSSMVLCDEDDVMLFDNVTRVHGLERIPSLNNGSDRIRLLDAEGQILDEVSYERDKMDPEWKREGGWSMILVDSSKRCLSLDNWAYSEVPRGGDPGIYTHIPVSLDQLGSLKVTDLEMLSTRSMKLIFDAPIDGISQCFIHEKDVLTYPKCTVTTSELHVEMSSSMIPGRVYSMELVEIRDCIGRMLDTTISFGIPSTIQPGDVVINELLFNPTKDGADFVELRNNSKELKDVSELFFFDLDSNGNKSYWKQVVSDYILLSPGGHIAISTDPPFLFKHFKPASNSHIVFGNTLPSLPDDSGYLGIANRSGEIVDEFRYSESLHSVLLPEPEGCSLEKINPFLNNSISRNWTSASAHVNFATPGYENSHYRIAPMRGNISVDPKVLDMRSHQKLSQINIQQDLGEVAMHVFILNENGILVRRIADGLLAGKSSSWYWDGTSDSETLLPTGSYLVVAHCLSADGRREKWKEVIHLLR